MPRLLQVMLVWGVDEQRARVWQPFVFVVGAPGRIRTHDPLVRSQVLYPTELRARCGRNCSRVANAGPNGGPRRSPRVKMRPPGRLRVRGGPRSMIPEPFQPRSDR